MKLYEGLFLFDANLATKDWPGLEKHVEDLLKKNEANLVYSERWPDRKLSYEVKGCRKGTYFLTYFNASGAAIPAIHRDVQLSERVLRLMVLQNEYIEEVLEKHQERQAERETAVKKATEEKAGITEAASETPSEPAAEAASETPSEPAAEAAPEIKPEEPAASEAEEEDSAEVGTDPPNEDTPDDSEDQAEEPGGENKDAPAAEEEPDTSESEEAPVKDGSEDPSGARTEDEENKES